MTKIAIWASRTQSPDPRTHFWFLTTEGTVRKVCDGSEWAGRPSGDSGLDFVLPCAACKALYVEDVIHGSQALEFHSEPIGFAQVPCTFDTAYPLKVMYTQYNECAPSIMSWGMPKISMMSFARFCGAGMAKQQKIVREARLLAVDRQLGAGRDYYGPLRNTIRQTHWNTGDISVFENALPKLLEKKLKDSQKRRFRTLGQAYIFYWETTHPTYFPVRRTELDIEGLTISVNPELGLKTEYGDQYVVKLWFNAPRVSRPIRQTVCYLMSRAAESGRWPGAAQTALWDIERGDILPAMPTEESFGVSLEAQATAFLAIWDKLEKEAQSREEW